MSRILPGLIYGMLAMVLGGGYLLLSDKRDAITTYIGKNTNKIHWEAASLQRLSPLGTPCFYPRMTQLKNGVLLLAYASRGAIYTKKSKDGGRSWQQQQPAVEKPLAVNMDTPEMLQLQNGALLLCYNGRPQAIAKDSLEPGKKFDIRIKKSVDNGLTWQEEQILYQAGNSFNNGCWEPSLLQLPSGQVQLFFSDEGVYTTTNEQNISMLSSDDNGSTWSAAPQIISFRQNSRDGMPVPLWLPGKKEIVVAIEDPGVRNFKPCVLHSSVMGNWQQTIVGNDSRRVFALAEQLPDTVYAGAPYLRMLSTGTTVLSYQSTENRLGRNTEANAVMVVATGDENATAFTNKTIPFAIPDGYHALWNSLCVLKGDSIVAVTSTNGFSRSVSEIWMIKGTLDD